MPDPAPLLQSQMNEVFASVKHSGLDPSEFVWERWTSERDESSDTSALIHRPSRYWFQFDMGDDGHYCIFSPGNETTREENYPGSWRMQMNYVESWLGYLKREIEAPDMWTMLAGGNTLSAAASPEQSDDNTAFTSAEQTRIEESLAEIRSVLLSSQSFNAETLGHIDARLEYLEQASERLGRKDWMNVAFSVITNIIIMVAIPPETARNILNVAGAVLGWVMGGSPLLPSTLH
jgi:hypothetical protein